MQHEIIRKKTLFNMDVELKRRAKRYAFDQETSMLEVMETALDEYLKSRLGQY